MKTGEKPSLIRYHPEETRIAIIGKGLEGILHDLDTRQGEALHTFMNQRAGEHARHTSLAFLDINQKITV